MVSKVWICTSFHTRWHLNWGKYMLAPYLSNDATGEFQRSSETKALKKLGRCRQSFHIVLKSLYDLFEFTLAWYVNSAILAWCGISNKVSFSIMTARLCWLFQQKWFNKVGFHMICQHSRTFNYSYSYYWVSWFHFPEHYYSILPF